MLIKKRIVAFIIALCVMVAVMPSITISTSADDNSIIMLRYQTIDSSGNPVGATYTRPLSEGFMLNNGVYGVRLIGIVYRAPTLNVSQNVYITFRFSGFNATNTSFSFNTSNAALNHSFVSSNNFYSTYCWSWLAGRAEPIWEEDVTWQPCSQSRNFVIRLHAKAQSTDTSWQLNFETPVDIRGTVGQDSIAFWPYIDNLYCELSVQEEYEYYQEAITYFSNAFQIFTRFSSFLFGSFDFVEITYDPDTGDFTVENQTGNWYDALLGTLKSVTADAQAQAEQQEKAKEAGAEDALDIAYDSIGSSFGALGDFSGLGSLGSFNGDALGQAGTGGLLSWFSQANADAIDAVPRSRAPSDIVDFYTAKIETYREEVSSDDTTDSTGD